MCLKKIRGDIIFLQQTSLNSRDLVSPSSTSNPPLTRPRQSSSPINPALTRPRLLRSILHHSTSSVVFSNQSSTHSTSSVVFSDQSYTTRPRQSSSPINPTPLDLVSRLLQSIPHSLDLVSRLLQSILHHSTSPVVFSDQSYTTRPRKSASPINPTPLDLVSRLLQSILHSLDLVSRFLRSILHHSTSSVVFSDQSYTTRPRQSSSPINPPLT